MSSLQSEVARLRSIVRGDVREYVSLAEMSRWKIGGPARAVVEPTNEEDVCRVVAFLSENHVPYIIVGDASNILFDDAGFDGVVLKLGRAMSGYQISGDTATAQAGAWVPCFIRALGQAGLSGAQHAIGIPGTMGGLVIMNGGSQRKGIGENLVDVVCCDRQGNLRRLTHAQCEFGYRTSQLQQQDLIVLSAHFRFAHASPVGLRREMLNILKSRRQKFPKKLPNCGSVFLSDPAMYKIVGPPGEAIERVGLKGRKSGAAQISPLHANFIVNNGGAKSADVLALIRLARETVHADTGFWLNCEVRHVSPSGVIVPAHLAAP